MKYSFNKDKLLVISILPIMWLIYFLFEVFSGRVNDLYTVFFNLSLILLFSFTGWIIYKFSLKNSNGLKNKHLLILFICLMILDQGIKIVIKYNYFNDYFEIIPNFLSFHPIINTHGSWLNARFNFNINFPSLILINAISLMLFIEIYRYTKIKCGKSFWIDMCFIFIFAAVSDGHHNCSTFGELVIPCVSYFFRFSYNIVVPCNKLCIGVRQNVCKSKSQHITTVRMNIFR